MMVDTANAVGAQEAAESPLVGLVAQGQSVWLDYITRDLVRGGELRRMIEEDGLRGMTSNPTIFEQAIAAGNAYDEQLRSVAATTQDAGAIFEALAVKDIQDACDLFRPVYDETNGDDGYVSIEVSPTLAHKSEETLVEARRLWQTVDRPNVMIKVPGTSEGAQAVRQLLREGININVTLLFSLASHERVIEQYIAALEERAAAGERVDQIASVASFFISRVDTLVDKLLDEKIAQASDDAQKEQLRGLLGKAAIANAKLAYEQFRAAFDSERFAPLRAQGARVQRVLWASTSAKNPAYRDVLYVEDLIGPDTVNTMPLATVKAFSDHGVVARTIDTDVDAAHATLAALADAGIDYDAVTAQLEREGVASFEKSYAQLIAGVESKRSEVQ